METLRSMILGESLDSFFYLNADDNSYIRFGYAANLSQGFLCMMQVRLEKLQSAKTQCLFSLVRTVSGIKHRRLDFCIEENELVYKCYKDKKERFNIRTKLQVKENVTNFILLGHIGKRCLIILNGRRVEISVSSVKDVDSGLIGASLSEDGRLISLGFTGEVAIVNFYSATPEVKEYADRVFTKRITDEELKLLADSNKVPIKNSLAISIDPKYYELSCASNEIIGPINHMQYDIIKESSNVRVFRNRPAKEVLESFGGFKTCLLLSYSRLLHKPVEYQYACHQQGRVEMCSGIISLLHAHLLYNDSKIIYGYLEKGVMDYLGHILELVGRREKFTKVIVNELFEVIELAFINYSKMISELIPEILIKLVLNVHIWSSSSIEIQVTHYTMQKYVIERVEGIFEAYEVILNSKLFRTILNILFDYYSPQLIEIDVNKEALKEIHCKLINMLMIYLVSSNFAESINILAEYLVEDNTKSSSIKSLLYILSAYIGQSKNKNVMNFFAKKDKDCFFIVRLFLLLRAEICEISELTAKLDMNTSIKAYNPYNREFGSDIKRPRKLSLVEGEESKRTYENTIKDHINSNIAYIIDILLTIQWTSRSEKEQFAESQEEKSKQIPSIELNAAMVNLSKNKLLCNFIWPKNQVYDFEYAQEILLHSLFNLSQNNRRIYGSKVYFSLLCHVLSKPETLYESEDIIVESLLKQLPKLASAELSRSKFIVIYKQILINISAFQARVQEQILSDFAELLENKSVIELLFDLDDVFVKLLYLMKEDDYFINKSAKFSLVKIIVTFMTKYIKNSEKHDIIRKAFYAVGNLRSEISIEILDKFISTLLNDIASNEEIILNVIQFVYFIEDITLLHKHYLTGENFAQLMGKLILYLSEMCLLYLWYPPLIRCSKVETELQREGGVARAMLKVILNMVVLCTATKTSPHARLVMRFLRFFLFRKHSTRAKLAKELGVDSMLFSAKVFVNTDNNETGFIGNKFNKEKEQMYSTIVLASMKTEKSKKIHFEDYRDRLIYVLSLIMQVFIYTSYNVSNYDDITTECVSAMLVKLVTTYKSNTLAKMLAKLVWHFDEKDFNKLEEAFKLVGRGKCSPHSCYSSIDLFCNQYKTETLVDLKNSFSDLHLKKDNENSSQNEGSRHLVYIKKIKEIFENHRRFKLLDEDCRKETKLLLLSETFSKEGAKMVHKIATQDFLGVEIDVQMQIDSLATDKCTIKLSYELSEAKKKCIKHLKSILNKYNNVNAMNYIKFSEGVHEEKSRVALVIMGECKNVLSEQAFSYSYNANERIYKIIAREYQKLLNKCPLFVAQGKVPLVLEEQSFAKLELFKDNMGRNMRLKKIKNPLKNVSVLKGITYMRMFFLKRVLIRSVMKNKNELKLVQGKYLKATLKALFTRLNDRTKSYKASDNLFDVALNLYYLEKDIYSVDMIHLDHSIFGCLTIMKDGLIFQTADKDKNNPKYRYGPSKDIDSGTVSKTKVWLFKDIVQIIAREYNFIKQAVEIDLRSGKSVFLVIYPHDSLSNFFVSLKNFISKNCETKLIEDPKEAFLAGKFTEKWKQNKISTFEYLMKVNYYAGRSFQDLSQYPVFPWVLANYTSDKVSLADADAYRDLSKPIAALTGLKVAESDEKYENTDDYPDGRFQHGAHYLPSRIVLAYLMRIQPYTMLIDRYDSGSDECARKFHSLKIFWNNMLNISGINFELIPEFFYCPEILSNLYCMN